MSDVGDDSFMRYVYRGEEGEIIPRGATHISVREDVTVIRAYAFYEHPNIVEVICHDKVEKIEESAFSCFPLRRVIMPGVKIIEQYAFWNCSALTDVECEKLEIIGNEAFSWCTSLRSINLPSARIVEELAFCTCRALTDANFGDKLERFDEGAFYSCTSLERITTPLRDGMIPHDNTFQGCAKLNHVHLFEGELHETVAALHLGAWRNGMNEEIYSINQTLPTVDAGYFDDYEGEDVEGEKAVAIRSWIRSVLGKIIEYKAEHLSLLEEDVAPTLQCVLPQDIVRNSVLPFLELPSNAFELVDHQDEEDDSDSDSFP